jgi:hypothetical protein
MTTGITIINRIIEAIRKQIQAQRIGYIPFHTVFGNEPAQDRIVANRGGQQGQQRDVRLCENKSTEKGKTLGKVE